VVAAEHRGGEIPIEPERPVGVNDAVEEVEVAVDEQVDADAEDARGGEVPDERAPGDQVIGEEVERCVAVVGEAGERVVTVEPLGEIVVAVGIIEDGPCLGVDFVGECLRRAAA